MNVSTVTCLHSGQVQTSSTERLRVNGNAVLVGKSINGMRIDGCKTISDPDKGDIPCQQVTGVLTGFAKKLKVNDQPVVLETSVGWGQTTGTVKFAPQPLAASVAGQTRLQAA
jgi:hypothetical protein